MAKWSGSYQHVDPARVGNQQRVVVSELSGRGNIIYRMKKLGIDLPLRDKAAQQLLEKVKQLESRGFQYENAEASFDLLVHRAILEHQDHQPVRSLMDTSSTCRKRTSRA
jgi:2-isopropylmalate synthase